MSTTPDSHDSLTSAYQAKDVNEAFRGGARVPALLGQINEASIVMLAETAILDEPTAGTIAAGILALAQEPADVQRSGDYLDYEKRLVQRIGSRASLVHAGRSRQDIAATLSRMNLRVDLLQVHAALARVRRQLAELAQRHADTVIPAYTHGVQAQPTTFAHYLLALASALGRQLERLADAYPRINLCPLGAAALSTSSFPIDRPRLSELLGFDGLVVNAYDANHLAPVDSCLELAGILANCAVQIGQFAQDLHSQYMSPQPWLTFKAGDLMGISSLMPQKRNPAALEQLRAQSSLLLGRMQAPFLLAHNVRTGMFDYRAYDPLPSQDSVALFGLLERVVDALVVNVEQARAEVDADYSTITEIADMLMQQAGVHFRVGHHYASVLTDFGRSRRMRLAEITHAQAADIYLQLTGEPLPLDATQFSLCVDPLRMIHGRKGAGGPQPAEVARLLDIEQASAAAASAWNAGACARLDDARAALAERTRSLAAKAA
jgi:argininosuccinate lyase